MHSKKFSTRQRLKSFHYAGSGILSFLEKEHNAWIHLAATVMVVIDAIVLKVTSLEAAVLAIAVGIVWVTEMVNTCLERMADLISPEEHPQIKFIKDLAAGAVLVAAVTALIIGLCIFIPKI